MTRVTTGTRPAIGRTTMTLRNLLRALNTGKQPSTLGGRLIGSGSERDAWRVGDWVIKDWSPFSDGEPRYRRSIERLGICTAPTRRAGRWVVQPYYIPYKDIIKGLRYDHLDTMFPESLTTDLHTGNVGFTAEGELVAFDW